MLIIITDEKVTNGACIDPKPLVSMLRRTCRHTLNQNPCTYYPLNVLQCKTMTAKIAPLNSMTCFATVGGLFVIKVSTDDDDRTAIVPSLARRSANQCFLEGIVCDQRRCVLFFLWLYLDNTMLE